MKKTTFYTLCLLLLSLVTHAQVTGDYRSTSAGTVDLNIATNWETYGGAIWSPATLAPNGNVVTGNTINILSGHTWGNTLDATIPTGVTLLHQGTGGNTTTATTITVNGTLEQNTTSAIATTGNFIINGTLKHNADVANILKTNVGTVTYATGSTIWVTGIVSNTSGGQLPTSCYNVIWDCPSQTSASINTFVPNTTTTISGDLTIHSTGNGGTPGAIYMGGGSSARTINLAGNLVIDGGELRLVNSGGTVTQTLNVTGNITISGTGKLTLNNSTTTGLGKGALNVKGNLTNTGILGNTTGTTVHQSTITFTGTGAQAYTSTGLAGDSVSVTLNGVAATTVVTLNSDLTLTKGVFTNTLGSLVISAGKYLTLGSTGSNSMCGSNAANTITLKSDATGTAGLGRITGSVTNTSRIMVERYIPSAGRKKYVLVTSPLQSTLNDWQEGATGLSFVAGTAGYGTQITNAVSQGTNGYDGPATSNASIFTYNDDNASGSKWVAYAGASGTNTALSLSGGVGYLLFVRGDRSVDRATLGTSSNTTLRARGSGIGNAGTGTISRGTVAPTLNANASRYTLIGNPYSCPIDWQSVGITKTGLTNSFTVYDPNLAVFVSSDGTTLTPQTGALTGTQQAQYIQSGQAFFVQNDATATHTISFTETAKTTTPTTTSATTVFGEDAVVRQQLNINAYRADNNQFADGAVALFGSQYKALVDDNDIAKFTNFNETFGLRRDNKVLGLEARPLVASTDTLYFNMSNFGKRDYNLVINSSNFSNTTATLEDKYTSTKQAIDLSVTTAYKFTVNSDAGSSSNDRFLITLGSTATIAASTDAAANNGLFVKMSPNPVANQLQVSFKTATINQATINIVNSLGQVVKTINAGKTDNGNITVSVASLSTGIYTVQLLSGDKQISSQKLVKE